MVWPSTFKSSSYCNYIRVLFFINYGMFIHYWKITPFLFQLHYSLVQTPIQLCAPGIFQSLRKPICFGNFYRSIYFLNKYTKLLVQVCYCKRDFRVQPFGQNWLDSTTSVYVFLPIIIPPCTHKEVAPLHIHYLWLTISTLQVFNMKRRNTQINNNQLSKHKIGGPVKQLSQFLARYEPCIN